MTVADSAANLAVYSKQRGGRNGDSGYPMLRLLALVSCGTRTVIDAVFRPVSAGETTCARLLLGSLHAGMLLLADRNFAAGFLAAQIAAARADFLIRVRTGNSAPKLPVLQPPARRVLAVALRRRPRPGHRRRDHRHHQRRARRRRLPADHHPDRPGPLPAGDLAVLYHERWEIETAYLELKSTILGGRVLRARTPDGIEQEVYALLVTYQALRTAIADAAETVPAPTPTAPASPSP